MKGGKNMARPRLEITKDYMLPIRMDMSTKAKLEQISKQYNTTKADIIRSGIEMYAGKEKEQKNGK